MPRTPHAAVIVVICLILISGPGLVAQTPERGDWSVVDRQPPGTALLVEMIGGEEVAGTLTASQPVDLTLAVDGRADRSIPKSAIVEVRSARRVQDSLKNGMAYGGLAGAAAMGGLIAALFATCEGNCDGPRVAVLLPVLALSAGAGIGAGAAVDAAIRRPLVLYRAPNP